MSLYLRAVGRIQPFLDRFRGVNKTFLFAVLSGLGAFFGSAIGIVVNPFFYPSARHVFVWDAWIGLGIGLTVAIVQSWSLGRLEVAAKDLRKAVLVSTIGGFLGGVALIAVKSVLAIPFGVLGIVFVPHVAAWTAEGIVIAFAVSRAIPNLKMVSALGAGTAAGFLGGVVTGWGLVHVTLADALKGVFIALALGVAEKITREAWLVLRREAEGGTGGGRGLTLLAEAPTLTLGEAPIRIGSSPDCQVVVKDDGGPAVRGEVRLENGLVQYHDLATDRRRTLEAGESLRFGGLTVEVGARTDDD